MIKYLILLVVVGLAIWWLRRGRAAGDSARPPSRKASDKAAHRDAGSADQGRPAQATPMLACQHCGVHLPQAEAVLDTAGRPYCGEAHRLAGPR